MKHPLLAIIPLICSLHGCAPEPKPMPLPPRQAIAPHETPTPQPVPTPAPPLPTPTIKPTPYHLTSSEWIDRTNDLMSPHGAALQRQEANDRAYTAKLAAQKAHEDMVNRQLGIDLSKDAGTGNTPDEPYTETPQEGPPG